MDIYEIWLDIPDVKRGGRKIETINADSLEQALSMYKICKKMYNITNRDAENPSYVSIIDTRNAETIASTDPRF